MGWLLLCGIEVQVATSSVALRAGQEKFLVLCIWKPSAAEGCLAPHTWVLLHRSVNALLTAEFLLPETETFSGCSACTATRRSVL